LIKLTHLPMTSQHASSNRIGILQGSVGASNSVSNSLHPEPSCHSDFLPDKTEMLTDTSQGSLYLDSLQKDCHMSMLCHEKISWPNWINLSNII